MKGWIPRLQRAAILWRGAGGLVLGAAALAGSGAVGAQTITPNTWNVIGLQGNDVTNGPEIFPVGARVCAPAGGLPAGYKAKFQWMERDSTTVRATSLAPDLSIDGVTELALPALAANACQDVYFNVRINQVVGAFSTLADTNSRSPYRIALTTAADAAVANTPVNRELYVEKLIAQNRNSILGYDFKASGAASTTAVAKGGSITVTSGGIYELTMRGQTATQGYEQLEQFLTLPTNLFQVLSVKSTYTAESGTDSVATRKLYADGCSWVNDYTNAVAYHTNLACSGTGKYGGGVSVTYVFKVLAAPGSSYAAQGVIYDYSGSSYHYNADSATAGVTINVSNNPPPPTADLKVVKTGTLSSPGNGDFVVTVTNSGPDGASNVVVNDLVPSGYTIKGGGNAPVASTGTYNQGTGVWTIGNLANGASATLTIHVQTNNGSNLNWVNVATVKSDTQDPNPSNNTSSAGMPPASADLGLNKLLTSGSPIKVGDTVTFAINAFNQGPDSAAANVVVSDVLPAGLNYNAAGSSCAAGWGTIAYNSGTRTATCTRTTPLAVNAAPALAMTLAATVQAPGGSIADGTPYLNSASISSATADPDSSNNSVTASAMPTFVTITKTANQPTYTTGTTGSYTLTVTKVGTSAALGTITVADVLPAGVSLSGSPAISGGAGWTCSDSTLSCTRTDGGDSAQAYPPITVNVSFDSVGTPQNLATVTAVQNPGTINEQVVSYDETVRQVTVGSVIWHVSATTSPAAAGTTDCAAPGKDVNQGQGATCTAAPAGPGYIFTGWTQTSGSASMCNPATNASCAIANVMSDVVLQANFQYAVTTDITKPANSSSNMACSPNPVAPGGAVTCTISPAPGETFTFPAGCTQVGSTNTCTVANITGPLNVPITFTKIDYSVTATVAPGGAGSASCTAATVNYGDSDSCTATPAGPGYIFTGWTKTSGSADMCNPATGASCAITNVTSDVVLQASFEYVVTTTVNKPTGSASTFTCDKTQVTDGGGTTCTAAPAPGEKFTFPNGCTPISATQCTVSNITAPLDLPITFTMIDYSVTATVDPASPGGSGTASCSPSSVTIGQSSTCTAAANPGYSFVGWTGDCASAGTNASCTLSNINTDKASVAKFQAIDYTVAATVDPTSPVGSGTASCSPASVTIDQSSTCTAVANPGYSFVGWSGDCASAGTNASCTLSSINADKSSVAKFQAIDYTVAATLDPTSPVGSGTASCSPASVTIGQSSTCTAAANPGYSFVGWSGDCASAGTNAACTLSNINANKASVAKFQAIDYTVAATVDPASPAGSGTVSCSQGTVTAGQSSTCTATPNPGYRFSGWTGDCSSAGANASCTLSDINANKSSTAKFEKMAAPAPTPVPTLTQWGLMLASAFMAALGLFMLPGIRRR
ncbi:hypothetical protein GCM10027082_14470 [Comamonas humi]